MELSFDHSDTFGPEDATTGHETHPPGNGELLELCALLGTFGKDEVSAFYFIAKKHAAGRARYGELKAAEDGRDFMVEAAEEGADLISYMAFEFIKRVLTRAA